MENTEMELSKVDNTIAIYTGASTLQLKDEEQDKLLASFDDKEIEIRPDGLIYLPQAFWRKRLNTTFGIGQWCLVVKGNTKDPDPTRDKLYLQGILMVRGCYVSEAVGEAELHSDNKNQTWASVWESAKSDCITRCCKDLGIASELWQPQFISRWIKENAIMIWRVDDKGRKTKNWRKKTADPFWWEKDNKPQSEQAPAKQAEPASAPSPARKPVTATKGKPGYSVKKDIPADVQDAINKLSKCDTLEDLTLLRETLDLKVVENHDFRNAGMIRYNQILNKK